MFTKCRSRRPWFLRPFMLFDRVCERCTGKCRRKRTRLNLLNLEDRITPTNSLSIEQLDALAYVGNTVAVRLSHEGSGTPTASLNWGDGSSTVSLSGWAYATKETVLTHTYSSAGKFTVTATDTKISLSDSATLTIDPDVVPSLAVEGGLGLEWGRTATPTGSNPTNLSQGNVRYGDGVVRLVFPDLTSTGFGMPWGQTRSWTNGPGYDVGGFEGNGWLVAQLPSITQVDGTSTLALVIDGANARSFDLTTTANTYRERYFGQDTLFHDTGDDLYIFTTPDGVKYEFHDFTVTDTAARGQLASRTDPLGNVTTVNRVDGKVTEVLRGGSDEEQWSYAYIDGGDNDGKLESVTWSRYDAGEAGYVALRKVVYSYYGTSDDNGNLGDLKSAVIQTPEDATISTQYYRYYKPGEEHGYVGGLKLYLGFASYDRADAGLDPLTATDEELSDFADLYFEYDGSHRVTLQKVQGVGCSMCSGGIGTYEYQYDDSAFAPGMNVWATKTTEMMPDDNQNVIYTNAYGQVMLKVVQEITDSKVTTEWPTYYRYDDAGRVVFTANPSAFQQSSDQYYDEARADLIASDRSTMTALDGTDKLSNTTTSDYQINPDVARDSLGNYVVVWRSDQNKAISFDAYGQLYNAAGQKIGSEFQINTSSGGVNYPQVAMDAAGNFTVVWFYSDFTDADIKARRYDRFGNALTSELTVNTTTSGYQTFGAIDINAAGQAVITWIGSDTSGYGIFGQRYNADGTAAGTEFRVNKSETDDQSSPRVALRADGGFVVSWVGTDNSSYADIFYRRFDADGVARDTSDVDVHSTYSGDHDVACDALGNFVITFDDHPSSSTEIYYERFDDDGTSHGVNQVNSYTTNEQTNPLIAMDTDGDFAITWTSFKQDGNNNGVYARTYLRDGTASSEFRVNVTTIGSQDYSNIAMDAEGNFVISFEGPDSSSYGAYTRAFKMSGVSPYLQDDAGLVTTYEYGFGSSTVAATDSTPGYVDGYLKEISIQRGETGTPVPQLSLQYLEITEDGITIHPLANTTVYRKDDGSEGQTTSFDYSFDTDAIRITELTITYPTVTEGQNGPDTADTQSFIYDLYGRTTWSKDGAGFLTYREYDDATGAVTLQIADVDTTQWETDYSPATAPWSTGDGLHLTSIWTVDFLGRVTSYTSPRAYLWEDAGNKPIDYTVYDDVAHAVFFYPAWDNTLNGDDGGPTGPTRITREDWGGQYTESILTTTAPDVTDGVPTGTKLDGSLVMLSLSRQLLNDAGQAVERDDYFELGDVTYSTDAVLTGDKSAVRHYATYTDYADRGGIKRTVTATGTITRYVRDAQNRIIEVWVGTNDTPEEGYWAPDNNDGTADMVRISSNIYDGDDDTPGMGDGNITRTIQYPGDGSDNRVTDNFYDWRNRLVASKRGVSALEAVDVHRLITYRTYDNLNHVTISRTYAGDGVTIGYTDGVPDAPTDDTLLRAQSTFDFDERGRVYESHVYAVDPTNGAVGGKLTTDTWYDRRGLVIKTLSPGGLVQKTTYDGLGRVTFQFTSDGGSDADPGTRDNWVDASDVTDDNVLEQSEYQYDENGNFIATIFKQRFHDGTTTGVLGDSGSAPYARAYFKANYYDRANRLTDSANFGTDGTSFSENLVAVPTRSATILINSRSYDDASRVSVTTDPVGSPGTELEFAL